MSNASVGPSDELTILRCGDGHRAAKVHRWVDDAWKTSDYDCGARFEVLTVTVCSAEDLSRELLQIEDDRQVFVIRGEPLPGIDKRVRRTKNDRGDVSPSFKGVDRLWVMFDLDKAPPPPPEVATGPCAAAVMWAIATYLPTGFRGAACHFQWSNSAGIKPWSDGLRLHLFFWLDRPVCDASWRAWARARRGSVDAVDGAVFTAVQPHYTARPIVKGLADPVSPRSGFLAGTPAACVPAELFDQATHDARLEAEEQARRDEARSRPKAPEGPARDARQAYARKALAGVVEEILGASEGARHDTINGGSFKIGRLLVAGGLDYGSTLDALQNAALAVLPKNRHGEALRVPREGLEAGMAADPNDLKDKGTRAGQGTRAEPPPPTPPEEVAEDETRERGATRTRTMPPTTDRPAAELDTDAPPPPEGIAWAGTRDAETGQEKIWKRKLCSGFQSGTLARVKDFVHNAPVDDHFVPSGHWMTPRSVGVWKRDKHDPHNGEPQTIIIAHAPVVVDAKTRDVESGATEIQVRWLRGKRWFAAMLPRADAAQASRIVGRLAACDFPVTSTSAAALVKYLDDYQAANIQTIPTLTTTPNFGWLFEGRGRVPIGFVWGSTFFDSDGEARTIDPSDPTTWSGDAVAFKSVDNGADAQLARALRSEGSFDDWRSAVQRLAAHPRCLVGLFASLSSLLLELVDAPNFCLDWGCSTTGGKTTSLLVAASAWGDPSALKMTWHGSEAGIEGHMLMRGCVPLFLDDTKQVKSPAQVTDVIYMVADGRGKLRGNLKRANAVGMARTVMLSTGERPAATFDESGGARVRCLEVTEPAIPPGSKKLVQATELAINLSFGHAAPRMAAWLLRHRDEWPRLRRDYQDLFASLARDQKTDTESRVMKTRALLELTLAVANKALDLDLPNVVAAVWDEITAEVADAAGSERALSRVRAIFAGEMHRFKGTKAASSRTPSVPWLGSIIQDSSGGRLVLFIRENLDTELKRHGFTPETVYRDWKAAGVSRCNEAASSATYRGSIDGVKLRGIALPLGTFADDEGSVLPRAVPGFGTASAPRDRNGSGDLH